MDDEIRRLRDALAEAQREIATLRAEVSARSAGRDEWLMRLAHELRTPLTVISGYNRLLLTAASGSLSAEQQRFLHESARCCRRLDAFVARLLDAAHDGFLEEQLELAPNDLAETVDGVRALLAPLLDERGLGLVVEIAASARRARFDGTRVEQVLINLLGNAIRFSKPGGRLRILAERAAQGGTPHVEVAVVDQGPGVPARDRERIFEPFVRLSRGDGVVVGGDGLGLGLAICRRIVAAHGGTLCVRDEPGGGSRFVFTLPCTAADDDAASATGASEVFAR